MMLAVLDPLLFNPSEPPSQSASRLAEVARILRQSEARIPDHGLYWRRFEREALRPLQVHRELRSGSRALRSFVGAVAFPTPPRRVPVWSFRTLFQPAGATWVDLMVRVLTGCVLTGKSTILITRLIDGRNARELLGPDRCRLVEKTCWDLRLRVQADAPVSIPLVCHRRNLDVPWTTRYEDRLPAEPDGAEFPFCPPLDWNKASTTACGTHRSRPAWGDAQGNFWACPATGWGHHWDVYLSTSLAQRYGLEQLNIVRWGAPDAEGAAGALHHLPGKKASRLKIDTGWSC